MRLELQMALDSKDSDIEQLRGQLSTLSVHSLDSTSISSGNDMDMDGYPGRKWTGSGGSSASLPLPHSPSLSLLPPDSSPPAGPPLSDLLLIISFPLLLPSPPRLPVHSAHHSLPHLRIDVLHLPAHAQVCLHRHAARPSLRPPSL